LRSLDGPPKRTTRSRMSRQR